MQRHVAFFTDGSAFESAWNKACRSYTYDIRRNSEREGNQLLSVVHNDANYHATLLRTFISNNNNHDMAMATPDIHECGQLWWLAPFERRHSPVLGRVDSRGMWRFVANFE